ncbi:MAG: C-factor, partial [Parvibaculum sp.]|nr:C-factor [Parvibaculum sp.]
MTGGTTLQLHSFPEGGIAAIAGATGAIGNALLTALKASGRFREVIGLSRGGSPRLDLLDEECIATAAQHVAG